jgi:alkylation response protein AidB-like acyl-CoA dehydrogenase
MGQLLVEHGSEAQRPRWLPAMARGERREAGAMASTRDALFAAIDAGDGGRVGAERD